MGVVKNLMVRIGADVRGFVGGMKSASSATREAKGNIQKDSGSIKNTVKGAFSGTSNSVRAYAETMKNTRQAHEVAKQDVTRLTDKVSQMKGTYTTVKAATAGLDLAKPLSEQMVDAEKALTEIEHKRRKIEKELASITSPKAASSKRTEKLQTELNKLAQKSKMAEARLDSLDRVAEKLGDENMSYASAAGLEKLRQEIEKTENRLKTAKRIAEETGDRLKNMGSVGGYAAGMVAGKLGNGLKRIAGFGLGKLRNGLQATGVAAANAAAGGVKRLGAGLKSLAGSALRGIGSLSDKLLRIGKNAESGSGGVKKLVQQIRNIGVVSLGMKVATGMFGQLRSIISSYISSNEELNAATSLLKNQLGQSLEPAIRLVITAMQHLVPVAQKVSSAIGSVLKAIVGDIGDVQYAFRNLGTYGFDQITKADEEEEEGETEQEQSTLVQKLIAWIEQLKDAFAAGNWENLGVLIGEGINDAFDAITSIDLGDKVGAFVSNLATTINSALETIDFAGMGNAISTFVESTDWGGIAASFFDLLSTAFGSIDFTSIGTTAATMINDVIRDADWAQIGDTIGAFLLALPQVLVGFVMETNWASVAESVSTMLRGTLTTMTDWIRSTDWVGIGQSINDLIGNTDWVGIAEDLSEFLIETLNSVADLIQSIDWLELGRSIADFIANIDWDGLFTSLSEGIGSMLGGLAALCWGLIEDAWNEVVEWWKEAAYEDGEFTMEGLLQGIGDVFVNIGQWIVDNIWNPFINGFKEAFGIASPSKKMKEQGGFISEGLFGGIKEKFDGIKTWVNDNLWKPFKKAFTDTFEGLEDTVENIFKGVKNAIKTPINGILGFINSMVSGVCNGINTMIDALNAISIEVPDLGIFGELRGMRFGFNLARITAPQIPLLAEGGIVDGPTQLIAGEKGKEAIVPLENNTEWIDKVADKVSTKVSGGGGSGQPMIVQLYIGKRKLTEYVIQDINQITKSTGVCPIKV